MTIVAEATSTLAAGVSWGLALPADITILIVSVAAMSGLFLWFGLDRAVSFIIALALAALLYRTFPYFGELGAAASSLWLNLVIFAVFVFALTLLFSRLVLVDFSGVRFYRFLQAAVLGVGAVGILLSFSYHLISTESLYHFGPLITKLFAPDEHLFWWLITPLIALWPLTRR